MGIVKGFGAGSLVTEGLGGSDAGGIVSSCVSYKLHLSRLGGFEKRMRRVTNLIGEIETYLAQWWALRK